MRKLLFIAIIFLSIFHISNLHAFNFWSSTFDSDSEGWQVYLGPEDEFDIPVYNSEGYICYSRDDNLNADLNWYHLYLNWEDWSELYGGTISFDIKVSGEGDYKNPGMTVILDLPGPVGTFFYANIPLMPPKDVWTTYRVPILDDVFKIYNPDPVNPLILSHTLEEIRGMDIRGDLLIGNETTCIDNVKIFPPVNEHLLRGRWDVSIATNSGETEDVKFFINSLELDPKTGSYFANGCMESSGGLAPLSLKALQVDENNYEINCYSTVIPIDGRQPYVIRFSGNVHPNGEGVPDDVANGEFIAANVQGTWRAEHHDRRRKDCPPVEIPPFRFEADVRVRKDCNREICQSRPLFEGRTNIASVSMLVEAPDGTTIVVPPFTDIYSDPYVDFVSEFRFFTDDQREVISGQPYTFTLLDALGNPIPGATRTDTWTACLIEPPKALSATVESNNDINLTWAAAPAADGFDPANGIGSYQITIDPFGPPPGSFPYGACCIEGLNHLIPWEDFIPGAPGIPDGVDFGVALNQLDSRTYSIRVESFAIPPSGSPGQGLECETVDFNEVLVFEKGADSITIIGKP
jgi:hypothetical protein